MSLLADIKVQEFLRDNLNTEPALIALKPSPFDGITPAELSQQLKGLQVSSQKLPEFFNNKEIIFPAKISLEQCSSELTAKYKATLVAGGSNMIDLSGGFGIDFYYLGKNYTQATYLDPDTELAEIVKANLISLGEKNRKIISTTAEQHLSTSNEIFDLVFVDPSRRSESNQKVFLWEDLRPDIISLYPELKSKTKILMIKGSPMIDISSCFKTFPDIKEIHIVASGREVKEVLIIIDFLTLTKTPLISCVILDNEEQSVFKYSPEDIKTHATLSNEVFQYIYDPHPVFLKAGVEDSLSQEFDLKKVEKNTHFYTCDVLKLDYPGRIFKITEQSVGSLKNISNSLKTNKLNVLTKNFPIKPEEILKKLKKKSGGNDWLLAFRGNKNTKSYYLCERVK
ncbi:THUMP-like domain-containing protein [Marinigracilibium pacificum]|uniref:THUMP-like domain-containing protein n=1 Tax=Marinigracilibium pacificum TaxID=2729599 RepID=A0A848IV73_9BACT|nr:hypothetical protein [Marinigracilibium pacificum]NMM47185.1 hypothetical protein [Marinigracilibium pacificum]